MTNKAVMYLHNVLGDRNTSFAFKKILWGAMFAAFWLMGRTSLTTSKAMEERIGAAKMWLYMYGWMPNMNVVGEKGEQWGDIEQHEDWDNICGYHQKVRGGAHCWHVLGQHDGIERQVIETVLDGKSAGGRQRMTMPGWMKRRAEGEGRGRRRIWHGKEQRSLENREAISHLQHESVTTQQYCTLFGFKLASWINFTLKLFLRA